jgi:dolichyl-phosphate-mannose-protein mannosyltransferase
MQSINRFLNREHWLPLAFLTALSFVTFVHGFSNPQALFWDENYHIASAQKYLNGVFFMEPHPPLGKLLIAAGEALLDRNPIDDQFIETDYATNPPPDFDFTGYRLFPVLLAWLTAPVLYAIFFLLVRNATWAMLLSLLYPLDNALLVHSRAAMLDSTMLFFSALTILGFLLLLQPRTAKATTLPSVLFGAAFGAGLVTKAFALLFVLLVPVVLWRIKDEMPRLIRFCVAAAISFAIVFVGTWYAHFAIGGRAVPALPDGGYYQSSDAAKSIIDAGRTASPLAFPVLLSDAMAFVSHYSSGVPGLDLAKEDENGSPWFLWPIGARTINYRWETPDGYSYRYLYLVANPVVWIVSFLAVLVGALLFLAPYVVAGAQKSRLHLELGVFLALYISYLAAISRIDRVMYLYHYFLPLFFSMILVGIVAASVARVGKWTVKDDHRTVALLALAVASFIGFQVYRPFTYYTPMTDDQVTARAIFNLWDMHCVECEAPHVLATPTKP